MKDMATTLEALAADIAEQEKAQTEVEKARGDEARLRTRMNNIE